MARKAESFPPVLVVSGEQVLLRQRFLRHLVTTQKAAGWTIVTVDGKDPLGVRDALQDAGMIVQQKILAVVENPEKVDLELLQRHAESKDADVTLLLVIDGEPDGRTKFGKLVKKDLAAVHKGFPLPDSWKADEVASSFVVEEAQRHGKTIRPAVAGALVARVGSDLGMLAFEIDKMARLADAQGLNTIDTDEVRGGMAPIAEASVFPISAALGTRDKKKLLVSMERVRQTAGSAATMRVARFLGSEVIKWMQAAHLDALPPKAAATELGMNPWYFEEKILPPARRWGKEGTVRLVADLAATERAVLNGAVNPWLVLTSRLVSAC